MAGAGGLQRWTEADSLRLVITIGLLIAAVAVLGTVMLVVRKRMFARDHEMSGARSLLDELRAMRKSGEMSEAEFEAAKRALTTRVAGSVKREVSAAPPASYAPKLPRSVMPPAERPNGTPRVRPDRRTTPDTGKKCAGATERPGRHE